MKFEQVYDITNEMAQEMLGEEALVKEDLSNIASIGDSFLSVAGVDNYCKALNDKIGRMVFVNRLYEGRLPSVLRDSWDFGSILEKVSFNTLPVATENESWSLEDNTSYDPTIFHKPSIQVQCWNDAITFEIELSITERQVRSAFNSPEQLGSFYSMIETGIQNAMTVRKDSLVMRTMNAMVAETFYAEDAAGNAGTNKTGVKAVNLLKLWNDAHSGSEIYSVSAALKNKEFIRFAVATMLDYMDSMGVYSTLYNVQGKERFTPKSRLGIAMHTLLKTHADVYLQSDTFNDEYTRLPQAETLPFWQGTGTGRTDADRTKVYATSVSGHDVTVNGLLAVLYDKDACAVCCENPRVTTFYNPKAEFLNEYHKWDARYLVDTAENCVIFYCDASA